MFIHAGIRDRLFTCGGHCHRRYHAGRLCFAVFPNNIVGTLRYTDFDSVLPFVTQTSAAVVLPRPGYRFSNGMQAPSKIAPVRARPLASALNPGGQPSATKGTGGGTASEEIGAAPLAGRNDGGSCSDFEGRHVRWQRALVKIIKRRIMAARFRLNQEAYRMRMMGGAKKLEADREASVRAKGASMTFKTNLIRYYSHHGCFPMS